jgi:hypothetical protein
MHDTHQKALEVNLDPTSFGSFAEIGAGQEVARWFLRVGAASGTVAKTVSAYDKEVSDDLYGSGTRYVSKPRLDAMLDCEWKSLVHQVGAARGKDTRLFAFANTISARNFAGTNDCHGWIGARFQTRAGQDPCDILLHVNLRDSTNLLQQEAVGVLGVNLLHAIMHERANPSDLTSRLFDNIEDGRVEIDQIETKGPLFAGVDVSALHTCLARDGRAEAVVLGADGAAVAANEFLYKKAVVIVTSAGDLSEDLSPKAIAACVESLKQEVAGDPEVKGVVDAALFVADSEGSQSKRHGAALITRHRQLYRATAFVRRYTAAPLRFAIPLPMLARLFDDVRYQHLEGQLLEGIARLFGSGVRVLAYPSRREALQPLLTSGKGSAGWMVDDAGPWITADRLRPAPPLRHLYDYLLASGFLVAMPAPQNTLIV